MLDTAVAATHHQKCIMRVSDIAHQVRRRLHHSLQIRDHFGAVDRCWNILDRDSMQPSLDLEVECLLIANQHWTVIERVEVGGRKDACSVSIRNGQHVESCRYT